MAAARAIATGSLDSEQLVGECLARIREREPAVQAWQHLDADQALAQARERDRAAGRGSATLGPLHGVPVGVKDIIDTADMPTENGSVLHAGRRPVHDAAVVARLRAAGAVILGKTVSTEFATYTAGKTRNPHDPTRTPGGSSSGSAAAVAAGMVPLAIGTQTNASVVRPAAYCGVVGFKPSHERIPRDGVLTLSPTLDTVGLFARELDDIALLAQVLAGVEPAAADARAPRLAFVKTAVWERADPPTRAAFAGLSAALGGDCEETALPESHAGAWDCHRTIMEAEMAVHLEHEWEHGRDQLSPSLRDQLTRGRTIRAADYQRARAYRTRLADDVTELFTRFDAILTPATTGTAPPIETTGEPAFGTLWTLCGLPAISLPLLQGRDGLPLGVQLVGACGDDARLLRHARWLERRLRAA
jgi:Asp-tRNA(Asn)/Glu-tRNA(Gln) amidotransferase A subunit family amidase